MLYQQERVPHHYDIHETCPLHLISTDTGSTERFDFRFEAIRPNVFRTTFTSSEYPLPHSSVTRPQPNFGNIKSMITNDVSQQSYTVWLGQFKARVEWFNAPVVSLFLVTEPEPIHRDLDSRSYAINAQGVAHYMTYKQDTLHVGLGEKAAPMNLSGRDFSISASDASGYNGYHTDPLHKHIPFLINATPRGCVGIFSTSLSRATWTVGSELDAAWGPYKVYRQAYGGLEEYLIIGNTVADVVRSYAEIVGFPLLVPRYMMGFIGREMKSSWGVSPPTTDEVAAVIEMHKKHGMPYSAFQINRSTASILEEDDTDSHILRSLSELVRKCHCHGVRLLASLRPYVEISDPNFRRLSKLGAFLKDPATGGSAVMQLLDVYGGLKTVSPLDLTSRAGSETLYKGVWDMQKKGIDAIWIDDNEYNIPNDDWECALEGLDTSEIDNTVGYWGRALHTECAGKALYETLRTAQPQVRPFVLTRSATPGTTRYCASSWSGNIVTSWEGMKGATSLALNAGFSLLQCYGHDIGYFEESPPSDELLVRSIQLAVYTPRFAFSYAHVDFFTAMVRPWHYADKIAEAFRFAIARRYELVPYTYSLMLKSHKDATPPQRWTGWGYESDPTVWTPELLRGETQYWFGDALLIAGVYEPGSEYVRVYLPCSGPDDLGFWNRSFPYQYFPPGQWQYVYSHWCGSIPVLARLGSAVPIGKPVPTTCVDTDDPEFSGLEKDDMRGVEIFPPPKGLQIPQLQNTNAGDESLTSERWFTNTWLEDDGIRPANKAAECEVTLNYTVTDQTIRVYAAIDTQGEYEPL